ncbi:class I SAM-dependent methyltransferase [Aestuariibaculum lutulentum]|uniref:Class I SAM-dependent methyltransferase n=1 Tax=Aestuariibaculum lutulentum TaxID=2920935 RepID=A0ABS9RGN1_9FLAO|nr:class I SAM-dependent methyltransferase [Aestuariibaculum lutulentum]MCH4551247.1 class I SAM-dependent methyltransferase [Aestuariibaculum lutulentum]
MDIINSYKFSCTLDYTPIMGVQTVIWLNNLLAINIRPCDIFIHIVNDIPKEFLDFLKSKEVNIIKKQVFDCRNGYCNKLVQLDTFSKLEDYEYVFLMDCDTAIVDLEGLDLEVKVYAKIVDFPNPPLIILKTIFDAHQLQVSETLTTFPSNNEQVTDWNNCNGGVYVISKDFLKELKPLWKKYTLWSIDNAELFGKEYDKHADQVGFALAMASLNTKVSHLGIEWNYPTHVNSEKNISPKIVHYHQNYDDEFNLKKIGLSNVDEAIDVINNRLDAKWYDKTCLKKLIMRKPHPRDISRDTLEKAFTQVKRIDLLYRIVDVSRFHFGFYTAHYPRVFEYTWILEQFENKSSSKVLDIGAGVCPVPLCLDDMGMQVTTVDLHPTLRLAKDKESWNEWGFLDYGTLKPSIKSIHKDFTKVKTFKRFDCIYSISVIEHMHQSMRLKMLKKASKLLRQNGELLLTIDIAPDTENIWNYSEGKLVESQEMHGTMSSFRKELIAFGFEIVFETIQRDIYESRTDVWYVKAELKRKRLL